MAASSLLLVGCGKMGGAMLDGWLRAGIAGRIVVVEPGGLPPGIADPAVRAVADATSVPADLAPDVVIFAVKPQVMDAVVPSYAGLVRPDTVFLSIAAGRPIAYFETHLGAGAAVVRSMPNTPAAIGRGITVACANARVTPARADLCERLLRAVGDVAWIDDEALMDAVTAVSGSGPAYVFLLVEALARAGEDAGLPADLAQRLARATVSGSGELLRQSTAPASQLREAVTSPGGTTRAALDVLMADDGLGMLLTRAVAAAARRSRELAQ
ncbi:pyrroline-5-carboxylate reductase [Azospirillum halopraeferens]|uniref:pyrroline-5-carboxylate reductase n=1 Tax=Azospirillum halopraeferens TaxID=34010 RepID=UPI00042756BC|nr:pyrroline-5-carboxylate reductase [Azospirillum halopraeferens]